MGREADNASANAREWLGQKSLVDGFEVRVRHG
jgi:hypothetical protein